MNEILRIVFEGYRVNRKSWKSHSFKTDLQCLRGPNFLWGDLSISVGNIFP